MKIWIASTEFGDLSAHATRAAAVLVAAASVEGSIMPDMHAPMGGRVDYCDVDGVALGDTVWVPMFISDLTGNAYIGGAYRTRAEAATANRGFKTWSIPREEKIGGGELSVHELTITQ